jgi:hypothetical protein
MDDADNSNKVKAPAQLKLVRNESSAPTSVEAKPKVKSRFAQQLSAWADQLDHDIDLIKSW